MGIPVSSFLYGFLWVLMDFFDRILIKKKFDLKAYILSIQVSGDTNTKFGLHWHLLSTQWNPWNSHDSSLEQNPFIIGMHVDRLNVKLSSLQTHTSPEHFEFFITLQSAFDSQNFPNDAIK